MPRLRKGRHAVKSVSNNKIPSPTGDEVLALNDTAYNGFIRRFNNAGVPAIAFGNNGILDRLARATTMTLDLLFAHIMLLAPPCIEIAALYQALKGVDNFLAERVIKRTRYCQLTQKRGWLHNSKKLVKRDRRLPKTLRNRHQPSQFQETQASQSAFRNSQYVFALCSRNATTLRRGSAISAGVLEYDPGVVSILRTALSSLSQRDYRTEPGVLTPGVEKIRRRPEGAVEITSSDR
jgi:hypothetical protein